MASWRLLSVVSVALLLGFIANAVFLSTQPDGRNGKTTFRRTRAGDATGGERCAINLYGLPRAFKSLVLPSLIKNVLLPNAAYGCDYYVHYYDQAKEPAGRSGSGGTIDASEVLLLEKEVHTAAEKNYLGRTPTVVFQKEKEGEFWSLYAALLRKIRTTKVDGKYLYFPYADKTYQWPVTTDNIVKMWHSIESVFNLMEDTANRLGFEYSRVAMLRADVVYVTQVDIYDIGDGEKDTDNKYAVIPGFGRHPISDRLIYGPTNAVRVWSSQRFDRMESHVRWAQENMPGWGMHSERFVKHALLPAIEQQQLTIVEHPTLCFFRVRADESVWVSDCDGEPDIALPSIRQSLGKNRRAVVEQLLGRSCSTLSKAENPRRESLDCSKG